MQNEKNKTRDVYFPTERVPTVRTVAYFIEVPSLYSPETEEKEKVQCHIRV